MTFLLYVLAFSLPGWSLVARRAALDGAGYGLRPGPRIGFHRRNSASGHPPAASASAPYGTAANDASMMMQPLPLGNVDLTGADVERPGHVCGPFAFPALRSQALAGAPTP